MDDGRDRDIHQRGVDDEHEHRHREEDGEPTALRFFGPDLAADVEIAAHVADRDRPCARRTHELIASIDHRFAAPAEHTVYGSGGSPLGAAVEVLVAATPIRMVG